MVYHVILNLIWQCTKAKKVEPLARLKDTLHLFDDVLGEEYSPKYVSWQRSVEEGSIHCDFCGSDIFESWLECRICNDGNGVILCSLCYVEGRACQCQETTSMVPMQLGRFKELLRVREQAASILKSNGQLYQTFDR